MLFYLFECKLITGIGQHHNKSTTAEIFVLHIVVYVYISGMQVLSSHKWIINKLAINISVMAILGSMYMISCFCVSFTTHVKFGCGGGNGKSQCNASQFAG